MAVEPTPEVQRIIDLYESGLSAQAIISKLNLRMSHTQLLIGLRAHDVEIRDRRARPNQVACIACNELYIRNSPRRKLCFNCAPTEKWANFYRNYGVTKTQFDSMWKAQSGLCAICENELDEKACIDHCHKQGHVRELLCVKCNNGLHYIEDDKFFAAAIRYVEKHRR